MSPTLHQVSGRRLLSKWRQTDRRAQSAVSRSFFFRGLLSLKRVQKKGTEAIEISCFLLCKFLFQSISQHWVTCKVWTKTKQRFLGILRRFIKLLEYSIVIVWPLWFSLVCLYDPTGWPRRQATQRTDAEAPRPKCCAWAGSSRSSRRSSGGVWMWRPVKRRGSWETKLTRWRNKRLVVSRWGWTLKMVGFPNTPMRFFRRNMIILGCEMGGTTI